MDIKLGHLDLMKHLDLDCMSFEIISFIYIYIYIYIYMYIY